MTTEENLSAGVKPRIVRVSIWVLEPWEDAVAAIEDDDLGYAAEEDMIESANNRGLLEDYREEQ